MRSPALELTQAAFDAECGVACPRLKRVMRRYAAFHRRMFSAATPCSEVRLLLLRESHSTDGIGKVHNTLHRMVTLALALGRALVLSSCESADDRWLVRGAALFKDAQPYECGKPHLAVDQLYEGFGGIDLSWSAERREALRARCGLRETAADLSHPGFPEPRDSTNDTIECAWAGCDRRANPDLWMSCGKACKRCPLVRCPALHRVFGPRPYAPAATWAEAPLLAIYNARRDAGGQKLPTFQLALAHGAASVAAPNGSTLGIAGEDELRAVLRCPYKCWAHVNYRPAPRVRALLDRLLGTQGKCGGRCEGRRAAPLPPPRCVHARTMWVDDQRCFPNPRGCQPIDVQSLIFYDRKRAVSHSGPADPRDAWASLRPPWLSQHIDHADDRKHGLTTAVASPLWWQLALQRPMRVCRVVIDAGERGPKRGEPPQPLHNLSLLLLDDERSTLWRAELPRGTGESHAFTPPAPVAAKYVRLERAFDEAAHGAGRPASLSLSKLAIFVEDEPTWERADAMVADWPGTCGMVKWRATCYGRPPHAWTLFARTRGWSGLMRCVTRLAAPAPAAAKRPGRRPRFLYLSTDSPAMLELVNRTFPRVYRSLPGTPVHSVWTQGVQNLGGASSSADYLKTVADFEALRLCRSIVAPSASSYSQTAASFSLLNKEYLTAEDLCRMKLRASRPEPDGSPGKGWAGSTWRSRMLNQCINGWPE